MSRKLSNNNMIRAAAKVSAVVMAFALAAPAKTVTLNFIDSVMVNDTVIRIGDIAKVITDDAALAGHIRAFPAGEAAPAGFSRFINAEDLVIFRIRPQFKDVQFVTVNSKRIKVLSDYQERTVGEFEEQIRAYTAGRLGWAAGEWELAINNSQASWKSGRGAVDVEISGLDNPYAKGGAALTLIARQGSRVYRVPVQCRIVVKAPVLVASRAIQRGEEFTKENSTVQVIDITSFAFTPLRSLPKSGTMVAMRTASQGNILHDKMLRPIPIVARGDQVRIHFIGERVKISVIGVARDNGGSGDRIWVENLQTGKLIRAAVSGRGSVVVHQEGEKS